MAQLQLTLEQSRCETTVAWQRFSVPYEFPVVFTEGLFAPDNPVLRDTMCMLEPQREHRLVVFIDEGVVEARPELPAMIKAYCDAVASSITLTTAPVLLPAGESSKSDELIIKRIQTVVFEQNIDRHSYVMAIGGGALLDAVGFVAATSHRGIRHIRVPTTVLSQNDSGVGVKNGVNLFGQKNYFGTFAPPFAVLNDYDFIECLPERERISGIAEAVKVALIRDGDFYRWLEAHASDLVTQNIDAMQHMIKRSAELHMHQIGQGGDPFETGSARPLDYGHWAAHRLETLSRYTLRHGEAVAIGVALDTRYSVLAGLLPAGADARVCFLLEKLGFNLWHDTLELTDETGQLQVIKGIQEFQEHLGGELTITLLEDLGVGVEVHEMNTQWIQASIDWLRQVSGTVHSQPYAQRVLPG